MSLWACVMSVSAQVTFDFDNAPYRSSLPIDLTVAGISARFTANPIYYNYSIQRADVLGFTPAGFSGLSVYPNTVYPCDLLISLSTAVSDVSIMYAPEEYATDYSCTMRITAYFNSTFVRTTTYSIPPSQAGTWPTGLLSLAAEQPFNSVVVHYEAAPLGGGDYGPIFMADNLVITPWSVPYARIDSIAVQNGSTVIRGVSVPSAAVTIEATDSLQQPFTFLSAVFAASDGTFQFEDPDAALVTQRFYRAISP